jgi:tetratricopeptide (TPR) repeat protein
MYWLRLAALLLISLAPAMPAAAQNDRDICARARGDDSMAACDRLIGSGRETGAALGNAFRSRCSIWTARRDRDRALADCNEAVRLSPASAAALIERGNVYRLRREPTRAIADYDKAIQLEPNSALGYRWRCLARTTDARDLDGALADCDQAIRIDSRYAGAYSSRCVVWAGKRDYERALKDCDEAIRLEPNVSSAYNNRGLVYYRRQDFDRAIVDYDEAIRLTSSYTLAYNNRGRAFLAKRNYDRALADFDQTIRLDPRDMFAFNNRGLVWARKRDFDRAIQDYDQAIKLNPRDMFAFNNRGLAYADKRDYDRAIADYTEASRIDPGYNAAFTNRGLAYERKGDLDRARADFRASLALPQKHDNGKWAHDTARERLAALDATTNPRVASAPPAAAPPVTASPTPAAPPPAVTQQQPTSSPAAPPAPPAPVAAPRATKEPIPPPAPATIATSDRVALLIGNAAYPDAEAPLRHPTRDARELAGELRQSGFEVEVRENLTKQQLRTAIDTFKTKIKPGSVALFYFSGFGVQSDRQSYVIPVDAQVWSEPDVRRDGTSVEQLLGELNEKGAGAKIVIIDASRRNPFERRFRTVPAGLAAIATPTDSLVMFSAGVGRVLNEPTGDIDISVFASELIKELRAPGATAEEIFSRTRIGVSRATDAEEVPWVSSSLMSSAPFGRATR